MVGRSDGHMLSKQAPVSRSQLTMDQINPRKEVPCRRISACNSPPSEATDACATANSGPAKASAETKEKAPRPLLIADSGTRKSAGRPHTCTMPCTTIGT